MKHLVISPHCDDAIFSIGSYLRSIDNVTILSIFAGIPNDNIGKIKHVNLRKEHERACEVIGAKYINGDFLDDVYTRAKSKDIIKWLKHQCKNYEKIFVPVGIHHPDHIFVRNIFIENFKNIDFFYEELPYRIIYPDLSDNLVKTVINPLGYSTKATRTPAIKKIRAVLEYESQLQNPELFGQLFVEERIWLR